MHPVLFEVAGFSIHTYGAAGALAFLVLAASGILRARALGVKPERTADLIFWTAVAAILGARLLYVLINPGAIQHWTDWVNFRGGGLVFYGGLLAGAGVGSALVRYWKLPFYGLWDAFAPAFALAHGISRLGCVGAGCCFGRPTELPWAITFPPGGAAPVGVPLHPTQLYEAVWLLILGAALYALTPRRRFEGQVTLVYFLAYAGGRSVIELFRGDVERGFVLEPWLGPVVSTSQAVSLALAGFALVVFYSGARRAAARRAVGASIRGPRPSDSEDAAR